MIQPGGATTAVLPDGKVLVTGPADDLRQSAELYDPASGSWTATRRMLNKQRVAGYSATLLANGKVLVAGGFREDSGEDLASAELYDPASGSWIATGGMITARSGHSATLLSDGRVLVAGGYSLDNAIASAELYDPSTGSWTGTGPMISHAGAITTTLLLDGLVLVAGCCGELIGPGWTATAELYDPIRGTWTATADLKVGRDAFAMALLLDGRVLVAGGREDPFDGKDLTSAELYTPSSETP